MIHTLRIKTSGLAISAASYWKESANMEKRDEVRYFVTNSVAVQVWKIIKKTDAYRTATGDGYGTVCKNYSTNELMCDEDSCAVLINKEAKQCCIYPYDELRKSKWFKQSECVAIIHSNCSDMQFWESEKGRVKIFVTYDEDGFIDNYRLSDWTDSAYADEVEIDFYDLPDKDPYE